MHGSHPIDLALSHGSRYLYGLVARGGAIYGFAVQDDGTLVPVGTPTSMAAGAAGLVAR